MYITNQPEIAQIAEKAGVDRIFIDMEYIGKDLRQGGMNTVQNAHTVEDIKNIKAAINTAKIMVRVNPIHEATEEYCSSEEEITAVIEAGADIVMLPYFTSSEEVKRFVKIVNGKAKTLPLVESKKAVECIDEILEVEGINEIFIGLNDLSLDYKKKFMFELLSDGTVEKLCFKFRQKGISYGFGGIAALGKGMLPAENVIKEHYRLGSSCVILSRSFCNTTEIKNYQDINSIFVKGIKEIRALEAECSLYRDYFIQNKKIVEQKIENIVRIK